MLNEQIARHVGPARIDIAYERLGRPGDPVVLLVMGLAAQMIHWPDGFVDALVARDLQIIRFDNRDAGHSTHFTDGPAPDLPAALAGDFASVSYSLSDMAADAVGLLDTLHLPAAHVVGASMGGAIAQTLAIEHPTRVLSLTSIMSTTGNAAVGQAHPATLAAIFSGPPATTRQAAIDLRLRVTTLVGSPAYPTDTARVAEAAGLAWDRDNDPLAMARQAVASVASGDRTERLRESAVPALVIHGTADTMSDVSGGRATAEAIPGAELVLIDGMGHDLPPGLWDRLADRIAALVDRVTRGGAASG
jgi:pimeloyl-ACP methyl ester carboxylesterase